ncbi:MAG: DUF421 domain-containing protein [Chloroflexota bacterium]
MDGLINLDPVNLGAIILRTIVVYAALLLGLRLAGKRELGQMTTFDLVVILVLSNAVQNAMVGPDSSLTGGLAAAATLLIVNAAVDRVGLSSIWLRERLIGTPTLLVRDGRMLPANMAREGVTEAEVEQALREHGVGGVAGVALAFLEVDGTISVVPAESAIHRTRRRIRGRKPLG